MEFELTSQKLNCNIVFTRPGDSCIFVDIDSETVRYHGQIFHGGNTAGVMIFLEGDSEQEFEKICRRWYKGFISKLPVDASKEG